MSAREYCDSVSPPFPNGRKADKMKTTKRKHAEMRNPVRLNLPFLERPSLVIDLGNRNTVIWHDGSDALFSAPTALALRKDLTGKPSVVAIGQEALELEGKLLPQMSLVHPLNGGMVNDTQAAAELLLEIVRKKFPSCRSGLDKVIISAPATATPIEKKAFVDVALELGPRKVYVIPEPMSAALGAGVDVLAAHGRCIVDVGDGIVESVVISMGEVVSCFSTQLEDESFEAWLRSYLRDEHNFYVSRVEAERVKILLSSSLRTSTVTLKGFCSARRLPRAREFELEEFKFLQRRFADKVTKCVLAALESMAPEMASDLSSDGLLLTGGNSIGTFLVEHLQNELNVKVTKVDCPLLSVTLGNRRALLDRRYSSLLERSA